MTAPRGETRGTIGIANTERRATWWIWVVVGVVVLAALGGTAWLLVARGGTDVAGPGATASPSSTPPASATPTASASPTPSPTPIATPSEPPTATPTPTPTPPPTPVPSEPPAPSSSSVSPFISFADWDVQQNGISVSATVPGIVESGGTCTITATSDSGSESPTVSGDYPASPSADSTECGSNVLASTELTSGTWSVTVSYVSERSSGISAASSVTIP